MLAFMLGGAYFALKKRLGWSGFLFGLGMASKWPAAFALLAVSAYLWRQKKLAPRGLARVLLFAGLAYLLVCLPFILSEGPSLWLSSQAYNIGRMSAMPSGSTMSSTAVEWLYLQRPVWFTWDRPDFSPPADLLWLTSILGGKPALGIVAFGNPLFWVPGLLALAWLLFNKSRKLSGVRLFSVLWFACTFVPFLLLPRTNMFIYYMLPVLPAYALALSQFLEAKKLANWYLLLLAASLALFLPLMVGLPAPESYYALLRPIIGVHPVG
jgi:predicted membrane-bound dolichyl-phosphate-mannose-protein mannosyltransferase